MRSNQSYTLLGICLLLISLWGCSNEQPTEDNYDGNQVADMLVLNGKILTLDENQPEVEALAIKGGRIISMGKTKAIKKWQGEGTKTIDLKGEFAMPAFIDGHGHFQGLGQSKLIIPLLDAKNWTEVIERVNAKLKKGDAGLWVEGRGWHHEKWDAKPNPNVQGYPVHTALSAISGSNAVVLKHASGHALFANAKAMKLAGVTSKTSDPEGGKIIRDENGNPTGVFEENAMDLITKPFDAWLNSRTEEAKAAEFREVVNLATQECFSKGIASFHDAGSTFEEAAQYKQLAEAGELDIRLYIMLLPKDHVELSKEVIRFPQMNIGGDYHLTIRSVKAYLDGALGSHGAWMLEPYEDRKGATGQIITPVDSLRKLAQVALNHGLQLCVHAIGDRANRELLDMYQDIFERNKGEDDLRWRIEHAQHVSEKDIPRFSQLGVIASMQGIHCTSDAPFVEKRLGKDRAEEGAYAWRRLIDSGAVVCNGTDVPVEDVDPIENFHSLVTRKRTDGMTFYPEQRMTRLEAIKAYTLNNAYSSFSESEKGSLSVGKLADIVVLSNDLVEVSDDKILDTKVLYTIVGGKVVYKQL